MLKKNRLWLPLIVLWALSALQPAQASIVADSVVTGKIKAVYATDSLVSTFDIHVKTVKGIVELSGILDTDLQFERAVEIAASIDGAEIIKFDKLSVKRTVAPASDIYTTALIKGRIVRERVFTESDVADYDIKFLKIETNNGVVSLVGTVTSEAIKDHINSIAKNTPGVRKLNSDLLVEGSNA